MTAPAIDVWASEHFGIVIANARPVVDDAWVAENEPDLVCYLAPADYPIAVNAAEAAGFRFADVRVTLAREPVAIAHGARKSEPADVEAMAELARRSHRITRFYADPALPTDACDWFYESWLRNSFAGYAAAVFVVDDDGEPAGYCTVHLAAGVASIGLLAVREQSRRRGLGLELVDAAVNFAHSAGQTRIDVVTQGRDVGAQRLYQRAGFKTTQVGVWLHRWAS